MVILPAQGCAVDGSPPRVVCFLRPVEHHFNVARDLALPLLARRERTQIHFYWLPGPTDHVNTLMERAGLAGLVDSKAFRVDIVAYDEVRVHAEGWWAIVLVK